MKVLYIEDDIFKQHDICKALSTCGVNDVDWCDNISEGWQKVMSSMEGEKQYDLIITDMYYPVEPGGVEVRAGDVLIDRVINNKITIPVILCSSANLNYSNIYGCVYYNEMRNWEADLQMLVRKLEN